MLLLLRLGLLKRPRPKGGGAAEDKPRGMGLRGILTIRCVSSDALSSGSETGILASHT